MTAAAPTRHPFLDDLSDDVVLITNALPEPVKGREAVLRSVKAGGSLYLSQKPTFLKRVDDSRSLFQYDAELEGGRHAECVVVIHWNADNRVSRLHISFAPAGAAQSFSTRLAEKLEALA
ncbi:MAG: hypothetical protein ABW193_12080 [Luteibacter sp.]|jgi:hypothetical protein